MLPWRRWPGTAARPDAEIGLSVKGQLAAITHDAPPDFCLPLSFFLSPPPPPLHSFLSSAAVFFLSLNRRLKAAPLKHKPDRSVGNLNSPHFLTSCFYSFPTSWLEGGGGGGWVDWRGGDGPALYRYFIYFSLFVVGFFFIVFF